MLMLIAGRAGTFGYSLAGKSFLLFYLPGLSIIIITLLYPILNIIFNANDKVIWK